MFFISCVAEMASQSSEPTPTLIVPEDESSSIDLDWYFDVKKVEVPQRVAVCRAYASYLVSLGKSGRERKGPKPGTKRVKNEEDSL